MIKAHMYYLYKYKYLGTAECYKSAILHVVQGGYTLVLCMLAEDLCRNDNGFPFLNHKTYYSETKQTIASSRHELKLIR